MVLKKISSKADPVVYAELQPDFHTIHQIPRILKDPAAFTQFLVTVSLILIDHRPKNHFNIRLKHKAMIGHIAVVAQHNPFSVGFIQIAKQRFLSQFRDQPIGQNRALTPTIEFNFFRVQAGVHNCD